MSRIHIKTSKPNKRTPTSSSGRRWRPKVTPSLLEGAPTDIKQVILDRLPRADYFVLSCCSKSMRKSVSYYHQTSQRPKTGYSLRLECCLNSVTLRNEALLDWICGGRDTWLPRLGSPEIGLLLWQCIAGSDLVLFRNIVSRARDDYCSTLAETMHPLVKTLGYTYHPDLLTIFQDIRSLGYSIGWEMMVSHGYHAEVIIFLLQDVDNMCRMLAANSGCVDAHHILLRLAPNPLPEARVTIVDYCHRLAIEKEDMELIRYLDENDFRITSADLLREMLLGCKLTLLEHYLCTGRTRFLWTEEIEDFTISLDIEALTIWVADNIHRFAFPTPGA